MPNTYTWTCPRCKHMVQSGMPTAPDNCPVCNYPDEQGTDDERALEVDVTDEDRAVAVDEGFGHSEDKEDPGLRGQTISTGPAQPADMWDTGWLGECMEKIVEPHLLRVLPLDPEGPMPEAIDWTGMAEGVAEMYMGERPTLLCGCPAGKHGRSFSAMMDAHPERATG